MRLVLFLLGGIVLAAMLAGAAGLQNQALDGQTLNGQAGTVEWRIPEIGVDRLLSQAAPARPVRRDFIVGQPPEVSDLGFYPSLSLHTTETALLFTFSEGWCCLSAEGEGFVGPVVTFTGQPDDQDLQVAVGDGTIPVTLADLLVSGNRIAVDLRGRDISGGRLTLLVRPGSNLAERATLALIGVGLIALGSVRRRWLT